MKMTNVQVQLSERSLESCSAVTDGGRDDLNEISMDFAGVNNPEGTTVGLEL